jgi:hypothetical protein
MSLEMSNYKKIRAMKHMSKTDIEKLHNERQDNNVSIYIKASDAAPEEKENQNRINLKNRIKEAKEMLKKNGLKEDEADEYLKPAYDLTDDSQLMRNLWGGLAMFLNENHFYYVNVPKNWHDIAYVGDEFYLAPVIEPIVANQSFYILSINLEQTRFFKADRFHIEEIEVEDFIPENMEEAIGFDYKDRLYQHVSAHTGQGQTFYHGHAEGEEEKKKEIKKFLNHLNDGLMKMLNDKTEPLVVESVDYIFSFFREINDYKGLIDQNISLSPERMNEANLHQEAWKLIEKELKQSIDNDLAYYNDSRNKSDMPEDIVLRALQGRVDTLFVNRNANEWGLVDGRDFKVKVHEDYMPGDKDLLNHAIINTYFTNGSIHLLEPEEMPEKNRKLCAVYRY